MLRENLEGGVHRMKDKFTINIFTAQEQYKNVMAEGKEVGGALWSLMADVIREYGVDKISALDFTDKASDKQVISSIRIGYDPNYENSYRVGTIHITVYATEPRRTLVVDFGGCKFCEYNENEEIMEDYRKKLIEYSLISENEQFEVSEKKSSGFCYIATAVYGSYDCPEVWTFRRYRDEHLASSVFGRMFIKTYYSISPTLVKWFGDTELFNRFWRGKLDRIADDLKSKGYDDTPYYDR